RLNGVQREALVRRAPLQKKYRALAAENGYTFDTIGSLDRAYEAVVLDYVWGFWQYSTVKDCEQIPADAENATDDEIWTSVDTISGFSFYTDQGLSPYTPYYYQAGTQLGAPTIHFPNIEKKYVRYGYQPPRNFVPRSIPMRFHPQAMRDINTWVRHNARNRLLVYGENGAWGAGPFRLGRGAGDSYVMTAPGMNHGANVAGLKDKERALATARILDWADVTPSAARKDPAAAEPLAAVHSGLDQRDSEQARARRPEADRRGPGGGF